MAFSPAHVAQLKEFVKVLKSNPDLLHEDSLGFFRDYLVGLGASVPEKKQKEEKKAAPKTEESDDFSDMPDLGEPEPAEPHEAPAEPEVPEEEIEEPVDPTVIQEESDAPQAMGNLTAEVSDESREKAQELRGKATELISSGDVSEALNVLTDAITNHNGSSAPLYASRAQCFFRLKKPASAIRDADAAIKINPDSAPAYRVRGRAKALLGQWSGAVSDLKAANQRDYDPEINDVLKELSVKADAAAARQKKRDEQKQRREAKSKPASGGGAGRGAGGAGGAGGGKKPSDFKMPPEFLASIMQDPEVMAALSDPEVMPILSELMKDPSAAEKYKDHPKLGKLISKFATMFKPPQ